MSAQSDPHARRLGLQSHMEGATRFFRMTVPSLCNFEKLPFFGLRGPIQLVSCSLREVLDTPPICHRFLVGCQKEDCKEARRLAFGSSYSVENFRMSCGKSIVLVINQLHLQSSTHNQDCNLGVLRETFLNNCGFKFVCASWKGHTRDWIF